jgi:hypothetical protein
MSTVRAKFVNESFTAKNLEELRKIVDDYDGPDAQSLRYRIKDANFEMEQDPNIDDDDVANKYGRLLDKLENQLEVAKQIEEVEERIKELEEELEEKRYLEEENKTWAKYALKHFEDGLKELKVKYKIVNVEIQEFSIDIDLILDGDNLEIRIINDEVFFISDFHNKLIDDDVYLVNNLKNKNRLILLGDLSEYREDYFIIKLQEYLDSDYIDFLNNN